MPKQWGALLSVQQPSIRLVPSGQPLFGLQRALELMRWSHSDDKGDILAINVCEKYRKEFIVNIDTGMPQPVIKLWTIDCVINFWRLLLLLYIQLEELLGVPLHADAGQRVKSVIAGCANADGGCFIWLWYSRYFCSWRRLKCLQFTSYHYSYWAIMVQSEIRKTCKLKIHNIHQDRQHYSNIVANSH